MLLRSVYLGLADSRAALAHMTGLTKPTVSSLVSELMEEGLLQEGGQGPASESGGKRPRLLEFQPGSRQVIGICVDHARVNGVLADLYGRAVANHELELEPDKPLDQIASVVDSLRAQLDAPLLSIGVGLPGEIDSTNGVIRRSSESGWQGLQVAGPLSAHFGVPVHVAHGTELSALAQYAFANGTRGNSARLVTLLIDRSIEVGVTMEGGSFHYGGDIGELGLPGNGGSTETLSCQLGSSGELAKRIAKLLGDGDEGTVDYLGLQYRSRTGDDQALQLVNEICGHLAPVIAWAIALLRPQLLSLAGPLTELGAPFLDLLREACNPLLPPADLAGVEFALAHSLQSGSLGAVALVLQKELDII